MPTKRFSPSSEYFPTSFFFLPFNQLGNYVSKHDSCYEGLWQLSLTFREIIFVFLFTCAHPVSVLPSSRYSGFLPQSEEMFVSLIDESECVFRCVSVWWVLQPLMGWAAKKTDVWIHRSTYCLSFIYPRFPTPFQCQNWENCDSTFCNFPKPLIWHWRSFHTVTNWLQPCRSKKGPGLNFFLLKSLLRITPLNQYFKHLSSLDRLTFISLSEQLIEAWRWP